MNRKTMNKKLKKQYVEHHEEHLGEDVTPFVAYLPEENQVKTTVKQQNTSASAPAQSSVKKKVRLWRRLTAIFS